MPIKYFHTKHRCNFEGLLTSQEIAELRNNKTLQTLQIDKPVDSRNWALLNEELFSQRKDVALRFYGFYNDECDISAIQYMPYLRHLLVDCLSSCRGYEYLNALPELETLSIGVEDLTSFGFLSIVHKGLLSLTLGDTKSSKPSVELISNFPNLQHLALCGHKKGIESITALSNLTNLRLIGFSNMSLSWMKHLSKLTHLEILLGGLNQLEDITLAKNIEFLELCWIRGLSNINFISNCSNLQKLVLDRLKQVQSLPNFTNLKNLKRLTRKATNVP